MAAALSFIVDLLSKMVVIILESLAHNWMILSFGIITAAALSTYVNPDKLSSFLLRKSKVSIHASVLAGAFTPFCACGTMAVIVGMLTTTLPWGPIMAFLTSSPLMSPDGFLILSGLLGLRFAVALTAASILIGLASGFITLLIEKRTGFLRNQSRYIAGATNSPCSCAEKEHIADGPIHACQQKACGCPAALNIPSPMANACCVAEGMPEPLIVREAGPGGLCRAAAPAKGIALMNLAEKMKLRMLLRNLVTLGLKQILLYFSIFVGVGYLVNHFVPDSIISVLFGKNSAAAVPLASLIGLPLYLTTESGIPIIQSLLKSGASEGAMLAFIITGSATSAWVIAGLATFMRRRAITLYVLYIVMGGILAGYLYDLFLLITR